LEEELGFMATRPAPARGLSDDAVEFIRFCYARRRVGWPDLYDEMCSVASRHLFRDLGPDELAEHGIRFGLFDLPELAASVCEIVAADRAAARSAVAGGSGTGGAGVRGAGVGGSAAGAAPARAATPA
jgi:hypothetical protein